eukprot:Cvel_23150.t1-p1 / transcript=Cvel_23150.t1 / gene=Cvel_23150 / organism=Chromera_velia_CCMP2878 / gene_product=hypothetical protein / transcript_product=hypothetical protein / location=Cvel_scaffold2354:26781-29642(+) / protein_length=663 / sequence_SO=supercontig / SO=protein_coding / is_pseudo=false
MSGSPPLQEAGTTSSQPQAEGTPGRIDLLEAWEALELAFICSACGRFLRDPRVLAGCSHTVCCECIASTSAQGLLCCPVCTSEAPGVSRCLPLEHLTDLLFWKAPVSQSIRRCLQTAHTQPAEVETGLAPPPPRLPPLYSPVEVSAGEGDRSAPAAVKETVSGRAVHRQAAEVGAGVPPLHLPFTTQGDGVHPPSVRASPGSELGPRLLGGGAARPTNDGAGSGQADFPGTFPLLPRDTLSHSHSQEEVHAGGNAAMSAGGLGIGRTRHLQQQQTDFASSSTGVCVHGGGDGGASLRANRGTSSSSNSMQQVESGASTDQRSGTVIHPPAGVSYLGGHIISPPFRRPQLPTAPHDTDSQAIPVPPRGPSMPLHLQHAQPQNQQQGSAPHPMYSHTSSTRLSVATAAAAGDRTDSRIQQQSMMMQGEADTENGPFGWGPHPQANGLLRRGPTSSMSGLPPRPSLSFPSPPGIPAHSARGAPGDAHVVPPNVSAAGVHQQREESPLPRLPHAHAHPQQTPRTPLREADPSTIMSAILIPQTAAAAQVQQPMPPPSSSSAAPLPLKNAAPAGHAQTPPTGLAVAPQTVGIASVTGPPHPPMQMQQLHSQQPQTQAPQYSQAQLEALLGFEIGLGGVSLEERIQREQWTKIRNTARIPREAGPLGSV